MWSKKPGTEAARLIALRTKVLDELRSRPDFTEGRPYFEKGVEIRLTLRVYVGSRKENNAGAGGSGDLDNFITGVCDGLMAAHPNLLRAKTWHDAFNSEPVEIAPSQSIAFEDDRYVTEICARKAVDPALGNGYRYDVKLEELTP